jgi:hypothetical protein
MTRDSAASSNENAYYAISIIFGSERPNQNKRANLLSRNKRNARTESEHDPTTERERDRIVRTSCRLWRIPLSVRLL